MTRLVSVLASLFLPLSAAAQTPATAPVTARGKVDVVRATLEANARTIAQAAGLSDEQQARVLRMMEEQQAAEKAWQEQNAPRIQALKLAWSKALADGDQEAVRKLSRERAALYGGLAEQVRRYDVAAVMTAPQKVLWFTHQLQFIKRMFEPASLSADQQARLDGMIRDAASAATCQADLAGPIQEIQARTAESLTGAQREALAAARARPASRPAPAAGQ